MKFIFLFVFFIVNTHHVIIIIPGTWATTATWYKPKGDFFEAVKQADKNSATIAFNWSCKIRHQDREIAASQLISTIESYPENTEFTIIAHSHGGNVGIMASQQLKKPCIKAFYGLGVPVSNESYYPNMDVIQKYFNLFSWEDLVQPLVGYERMYEAHDRIWNISIKLNGLSPDHINMHHYLVGRWIFYVEKIFKDNKNWWINFKPKDFDCGIEYDRQDQLEFDQYVINQIPSLLCTDKTISINNLRI